MTDPSNGPPFVLGVPDSTGMGGLPTLGSSLPHYSTNWQLIEQISHEYADVLKRLAGK